MKGDTEGCLGKVAIRTHDTEYYGDEEALTTSYVTYSKQWDTNPNTGSAWTWDEIDALEIGATIKKVVSHSALLTQVYAEVDYAADPTLLMENRYTWDGGGNLTQREDVIASETENFTYDFLNRLTAV